jgi:hypothetical protein
VANGSGDTIPIPDAWQVSGSLVRGSRVRSGAETMMKQSLAAMVVLLAAASMAHAQGHGPPFLSPFKVFKCTVVSVEGSSLNDLARAEDARLLRPVRVGDIQLLAVGPRVWMWNKSREDWGINWCLGVSAAVSTSPVVSCKSSRGLYAMTRNWVHAARPIAAEDDFDRAAGRWKEVGRETVSGGTAIFQVDRDCHRVKVRHNDDTADFGWERTNEYLH